VVSQSQWNIESGEDEKGFVGVLTEAKKKEGGRWQTRKAHGKNKDSGDWVGRQSGKKTRKY